MLIVGNFMGTNASGTVSLGNGGNGIIIASGSSSNTIGGTTVAARNIISGNKASGLEITDSGTTQNLMEGNYIGTDASGTGAAGQRGKRSQRLFRASGNIIGGTTAAARNIISGNLAQGVAISGTGAAQNVVEGNSIGTDASGSASLGNEGSGVFIGYGASGNTIGGTAAGATSFPAIRWTAWQSIIQAAHRTLSKGTTSAPTCRDTQPLAMRMGSKSLPGPPATRSVVSWPAPGTPSLGIQVVASYSIRVPQIT